ncbi:MAG: alpha/beta fold hydrolase [Gemmatimonadaceae bacterium]|nr:alpha/beta fold hydrolase [Gemmatimonadaceae bacterium]
MLVFPHVPLPNPLGGQRREYRWRGHQIAYVVRGDEQSSNTPLFFVHSIHAAAWSAEWRFVFGPLSEREGNGPAYALDLLGFGASDRPPLKYTAQLYIDLVSDFTSDVIGRAPIAFGSSLGASYIMAAEAAHPGLFSEITAIGPAGISRLYEPGSALNHAVERLFRSKVPGTALFRALVSRPSIQFFLKDIYSNPACLTPEAISLFWQAANHPNARYAPAAFVGMRLNTNLRSSEPAIRCPLHLIWGTKAAQTPYKESPQVREAFPHATFTAIESGDLPHEENPRDFLRATQAVPAVQLP